MNVPLRKAPEVFFDPQQWADFTAHFKSREVALKQISVMPYGPAGFYLKDNPRLSTSTEIRTRQINELFELGVALIGAFKTKLIEKQIIATGVLFGLEADPIDRVSIPADKWERLWPYFIGDTAIGELFEFRDVLLSRNDDRKTRDAELKERCIAFLRKRSADGEGQRKILEPEAYKHFGNDLKTRVFNAAYTAVARTTPHKKIISKTFADLFIYHRLSISDCIPARSSSECPFALVFRCTLIEGAKSNVWQQQMRSPTFDTRVTPDCSVKI